MVRKLKYHEKKLLKKVDFISWEVDNSLHENKVVQRFYIQKREDYTRYNKASREIRNLARKIKELDMKDPFRKKSGDHLLQLLYAKLLAFKLSSFAYLQAKTGSLLLGELFYVFGARIKSEEYSAGLISTNQGLELCDKVTASSFCRRRLPVLMVRSHMAPSLKVATKFVQHGHVRVGPDVVMDPAFLVTRSMEDFITWVDTSAIKKHVSRYNEQMDDFDLM